MKSRIVYPDGTQKIVENEVTQNGNIITASLKKENVSGAEYIDFMFDYFTAKSGDEGYFVTNTGLEGTAITRFTDRNDEEFFSERPFVGCYGFCKKDYSVIGILKTLRCDAGIVRGVKNGVYYTFFRYFADGDELQDNIVIEYRFLESNTYSALANEYRNFMLTEGKCVPLKERIEKDCRLKKSANGINIRVRQGWKPAPSPVEDQTPETEPEMYVACTFERVGDIVDEFQNQNIKNAEFCLVGWNSKGHDGRFPQIFPVEPTLGGEEKLKELINKVKGTEYAIVCHDDATAAYKIADCYDDEYILKNKDGSLHKRPTLWSGGRPYKICPKRQYELFELPNQKKIADLGFEGIHYIDVITILPVLKCYDELHKLNRDESAEYYKKIMKLSRENFGGFSSESGYDFGAEYTDYVMYPDFATGKDNFSPLCDEIIPFWHMVYHGVILYNISTETLNYAVKSEKSRLKSIELGGRPLICYYANFANGNNWMGKEDFLCDTDDMLKESVRKAKLMADDYDMLKDERFEFITSHEKISDGIYCTTYSNGTKVLVNYNDGTYTIEK